MSKESYGVLVGLVKNADGETCIGIGMPNGPTIGVSVEHAAIIFNQIGELLDSVGYFKEDKPDCREGERCTTH